MSTIEDEDDYGLSLISESKAIDAPILPYLPRLPERYRPKIALIGCGGIAPYHLEAYQALGLEVVALCDPNEARAASLRDAYFPDAQVLTDHRDVMSREDISVVDAATHPGPRVGIMEDAIRAGKHILSQKPFVADLEEGARLLALADKHGVKIAVNQNGRWAPHFSYMREAIAAGLIGEPVSATYSVHWDHTWIKDTPFNEIHHLILYDFAIHWFDIQTAFFGDKRVTGVSASIRTFIGQEPKPPILGQVAIQYEDAQATMSFNGHVYWGQQDETTICGKGGTIRSTGPSLSDQYVSLYTPAGHCSPVLAGTWFTNGFQGTMCELLCAIEENRAPVNGARANLQSLALCFAALASADNGGVVVRPGDVKRASA